MAERTVTISGLSKTFSIAGWRIGYLAADAQWIPTIRYFHDLLYVYSPGRCNTARSPARSACRPRSTVEYQQKRDQICAALSDSGMTPSVPDGAYYILADASRIPGADGLAKARHLLKATGVAAVAGSAFFSSSGGGDSLLRFCFGKTPETLDRTCAALRAF